MNIDKWLPPLASGGGLAVIGLLGRTFKRWRKRLRFGHIEDERLVTELVKRAVETQADVLEDLRRERVDDRAHIDRLNGVVGGLRERVAALESEVGQLTRERDEARSAL